MNPTKPTPSLHELFKPVRSGTTREMQDLLSAIIDRLEKDTPCSDSAASPAASPAGQGGTSGAHSESQISANCPDDSSNGADANVSDAGDGSGSRLTARAGSSSTSTHTGPTSTAATPPTPAGEGRVPYSRAKCCICGRIQQG
jgi:hypothetical protein